MLIITCAFDSIGHKVIEEPKIIFIFSCFMSQKAPISETPKWTENKYWILQHTTKQWLSLKVMSSRRVLWLAATYTRVLWNIFSSINFPWVNLSCVQNEESSYLQKKSCEIKHRRRKCVVKWRQQDAYSNTETEEWDNSNT